MRLVLALLAGLAAAPALAQQAGTPPAPGRTAPSPVEEAQADAARAAAEQEAEKNDDTPAIETESSIDDVEAFARWTLNGDIRPIIQADHDENRDGSSDSDGSLGLRTRAGAVLRLTDSLRLGGRLAFSCFTDACDIGLANQSAAPSGSSLEGGKLAFDELYVHWYQSDRADLAVGRLQTRFVLRGGVYAKSLDRNDSNNVNITWTDGLHATYRGVRHWHGHLIAQYNDPDGASAIRHGPLDFDDDGARLSWFAGIENTERWRHVVQRAFDISVLPDSLLTDGTAGGRREDYIGLVGRLAFRVPNRSRGPRLRFGTELGYAPRTQTGQAAGLGGGDDADGLAWNVVASVMDFLPRQSIGLNCARTGAGWLLSPQYRPNDELIEIRYQVRPRDLPLMEARVRRREDLQQLLGARRKQRTYDVYIRATWQFRTLTF